MKFSSVQVHFVRNWTAYMKIIVHTKVKMLEDD